MAYSICVQSEEKLDYILDQVSREGRKMKWHEGRVLDLHQSNVPRAERVSDIAKEMSELTGEKRTEKENQIVHLMNEIMTVQSRVSTHQDLMKKGLSKLTTLLDQYSQAKLTTLQGQYSQKLLSVAEKTMQAVKEMTHST